MSSAIKSNTVVERTVELIQMEIDGDLVALDIDGGNCFGFNATATRVWQMLEQPQSVDAIVAMLTEEFAIDHDECQAAVVALIDEMADRKLVRIQASACEV